jgi:hypothetical protein
MMKIVFHGMPRKITQFLVLIVSGLILANIVGIFSKYVLHHWDFLKVARLFILDAEANIPTWYSSFALLICSILLGVITLLKKETKGSYLYHWASLSLIFLFLSIEEQIGLHERTMEPLRSALNVGGFLYFAWVIPGTIFSLIILLLYQRFLVALPIQTRRLFILAGSVYIAGSIGLEMLGAPLWDLYGGEFLLAAIITTLEEAFEMFGVIVFIYALLSYLSLYVKEITITTFKDDQSHK